MKIAVVGTGAMGSVYAALLGDAGNEVWAIDSWADHVAVMRDKGLRLEGASGDRTVKINATDNPSEAGTCDLVIIATKAMHVEIASRAAAPLVGDDTILLPIQNGLGSADKVAAILGGERMIIGVVGGFGASMRGPGHAHHNGMELLRLGEPSGPVTERVEHIASVWADAGFKVKAFDDIQRMIWEKLICNVAFSGCCTLTQLTVGEVIADPSAWSVSQQCATEAYIVARAKEIALEFDDPVSYVRDFGGKIPNARPSMLLDRLAGRAGEIDVINGAIPVQAQSVGLPAPVNDTVSNLVRGIERRDGLRRD